MSYNTSIGSFTITNFFSYYKFNFNTTIKQEVELDSKTTLVEAAASIYKDANSFWLILLANKWMNPFTLFHPNPALFNEENENKNTTIFINRTSGTPYYVSSGSIITPFAATGGNPYDYSYVGNFSLNEDFYVVENQNFYTKRIVVKPDPTTGIKADLTAVGDTPYKFLDKTSFSSSVLENSGISSSVDYLNSIELSEEFGAVLVEDLGSLYSVGGEFVEDAVSEDYTPTPSSAAGSAQQNTLEEVIKTISKKINIFESGSISQVTRKLVVVKYT